MKRYILTWIITLICILGYSQIIELDANNPAPRVGEEISLTYTINWSEIEKNIVTTENYLEHLKKQKIGKGTLILENYTIDTVEVIVGPFIITIDGQTYRTDSIALNIYPELPNEKNGFWLRLVVLGDQHYIVTEQRILDLKGQNTSNGIYSDYKDNYEIKFAEIPWLKIDLDNIKVHGFYSNEYTQYMSNENDSTDIPIKYKLTVYKIEFGENYKNDFILDKEHFNNFPNTIDFKPIEIIIK